MTDPIVVSPVDSDNLKRCRKCGEWKARSSFSPAKKTSDGLYPYCKPCNSARKREWHKANPDKQRNYRAENREKILAYGREYVEANHEKELARLKKWRSENKGRIAEYQLANRERIADRHKEWRAANPDKVRAHHHRRRAQKKRSSGTYSQDDLTAIRIAQTDKRGRLRCWWCGKSIKVTPHLDHKVALSKGGSNGAENLCYACPSCNQHKSAKHPFELGRLL